MKNENGFLLIEVLVTLAVLSFGIVMAVTTIHKCLSAAKTGSHYAEALRAAEEKLWELRTEGKNELKNSGIFRFRAEREVVPGAPFERVKLCVSWNESEAEKELWLSTYAEKK